MKNKVVISSLFVCVLLSYVGCKKAELTPQAPPIDNTGNIDMQHRNTHYSLDELNDYNASAGGNKKCNKCHATK